MDSEPIEARAEAVVLLKQLNFPVGISSFYLPVILFFTYCINLNLSFCFSFYLGLLRGLPIYTFFSLLCIKNLFRVLELVPKNVIGSDTVGEDMRECNIS